MSTTPTIFRRPRAPYTVLGGARVDRIRKERDALSVLVLNRGSRFDREQSLAALAALAAPAAPAGESAGELLWVEGTRVSHEIEPLSRRFPDVRFLLLQDDASPGEWVNLGMDETRSRRVFVLWSDMRPSAQTVRYLRAEPAGEDRGADAMCLVPQLRGPSGEVLPTIRVPALVHGRLDVLPFSPVRPGMSSLLPYDYCGIYDRRRFQASGGFDTWMRNPYWQKLDFGLRCGLWGERIRWQEGLEVRYLREPEADDTSPDASYKLLYLKSLAVRFNGEMGTLPGLRWLTYALRSSSGLSDSLREFREIRDWVHEHRYRFRCDLAGLVNRWEMPA